MKFIANHNIDIGTPPKVKTIAQGQPLPNLPVEELMRLQDLGAISGMPDDDQGSDAGGGSRAEQKAARKAEAERRAAEKADAERKAAEQAAAERAAAERAEGERLAAEKAEAERIEAERIEAERKAREQAGQGAHGNQQA